MRAKSVLSMVLLVFVAFAVGAVVAKAVRQNSAGSSAGDSSQAAGAAGRANPAQMSNATSPAAETAAAESRLVAYYFHATRRCPTCQRIEIQAHEAAASAFGPLLADGRLRWESRNFEEPENYHFITEFRLVAPSLVIAKVQGDQVVAWKNLDMVWDLVHVPGPYAEYVVREFRSFIETNMPEVLSEQTPGGDSTASAG